MVIQPIYWQKEWLTLASLTVIILIIIIMTVFLVNKEIKKHNSP